MEIWNDDDIQSTYQMADAIKDIEALLKNMDAITTTQRLVLPTGDGTKSMLYMPSIHLDKQMGIVKIISITPKNPQYGRPTTQANMMLTNIETGEHVASLEASYLTRLRTGALSGIATKYMSRKHSQTLGLIGTGGMAFEQLLGNLHVRPIKKILLHNRTRKKAEKFKQRISESYPTVSVEIVNNVQSLVKNVDIINCQTASSSPVFDAVDVQIGTHINGIGSYRPDMKELDFHLFPKAHHIVFDDIEGVKEEAGEFIEAHKTGIFRFEEIAGDLRSIVANEQLLRERDDEITIFKCVGAAHFDLAVAMGAYNKLSKKSN